MVETMYAAPASAWPHRRSRCRCAIIVDLSVGEESSQLIKLINPEFVLRQGGSGTTKAAFPPASAARRCARRASS
jgi:hypothetical protein